MAKIRIDKFISIAAGISRKEARTVILSGAVFVNGEAVKRPECQIDDESTVTVNGEKVNYSEFVYFMLNKPAGMLSATRDRSAETVMDLLPEKYKKYDCSPVGRLDKDTTGLLLLTNDGDYLHRVISPNSKVEKQYLVQLDGQVMPEHIGIFKKGVVLASGEVCKPARLEIIGEREARITITEGKYHEIKRMFGTVGLGVNALKRERIGALVLDDKLAPGELKQLETAEANAVFAHFSEI